MANMRFTELQVMGIVRGFPMGEQHGRGQEYYAAKANIAALFMSRELHIPMEEIEERLCQAMGIEKLGEKSAEIVLGLRRGVTMDYTPCQLAIENNQSYFNELKTLVRAL